MLQSILIEYVKLMMVYRSIIIKLWKQFQQFRMLWHPLGGKETGSNNCLQKSGMQRKNSNRWFFCQQFFVCCGCLFVCFCMFLLYFSHIFFSCLFILFDCFLFWHFGVTFVRVFVYCCSNIFYQYLSSRLPIMFDKHL